MMRLIHPSRSYPRSLLKSRSTFSPRGTQPTVRTRISRPARAALDRRRARAGDGGIGCLERGARLVRGFARETGVVERGEDFLRVEVALYLKGLRILFRGVA